jgi:hypothetical protein
MVGDGLSPLSFAKTDPVPFIALTASHQLSGEQPLPYQPPSFLPPSPSSPF